jgi:hypothetical protein
MGCPMGVSGIIIIIVSSDGVGCDVPAVAEVEVDTSSIGGGGSVEALGTVSPCVASRVGEDALRPNNVNMFREYVFQASSSHRACND